MGLSKKVSVRVPVPNDITETGLQELEWLAEDWIKRELLAKFKRTEDELMQGNGRSETPRGVRP